MRRQPAIYRRKRPDGSLGDVWYVDYYKYGRRIKEAVGPSYAEAVKVRQQRLAEVRAGKFGLKREKQRQGTVEDFYPVWREEVMGPNLAPSTQRGYETAATHHVHPEWGHRTWEEVEADGRVIATKWKAKMAKQQRWDYTKGKNPNPGRPTLAPATIRNAVSLASSIFASAVEDYGLLEANPLQIPRTRRRRRFPTEKARIRRKVHFLEPEAFKRSVDAIRHEKVRRAVLFAAFTGLRKSEQWALRADEDIDWRRNRIVVTRSLYLRVPGRPKTEESEGEVPMCPTVRRILKAVTHSGYVFSPDGVTPIGRGGWLAAEWNRAQIAAGVKYPISWHALRHQFVSLLVAAGKHPKEVSVYARHASFTFTMDKYGHLFETMPITPVEWWDDLLWPEGCPHVPAATDREAAMA